MNHFELKAAFDERQPSRRVSKIKNYPNGHATMERLPPSGMYLVECRLGGELHDKIRCDDYRGALEYFRAFSKIARNHK